MTPETWMRRRFCAGNWLGGIFLALVFCAFAPADFYPDKGDIAGGAWVYLDQNYYYQITSITFDDVEASALDMYDSEADEDGKIFYRYRVKVPPHAAVGEVQIAFTFIEREVLYSDYFAEPFTYVDAPALTSVAPSQHSIITDDFPVKITCQAVSVQPGVQVYFGGRPATDVTVNERGIEIVCVAPPFPGGHFPLPVDVRVVSPNGKDGVLTGKYEYNRVTPTLRPINSSRYFIDAWKTRVIVNIYIDHLVPGEVQAYFDGKPAAYPDVLCCSPDGSQFLNVYAPPHAPGRVEMTILNGDGGIYTKVDAAEYFGTPSTDFHTADQNHDFRIQLSELLRVIQYFNVGSLHCEAGTEDGYAPGPGDESCAPYASDHDPQDWQIELPELLELIQFYNLYCYQPCPGAPGTYCPPD